MYYEAIFEPSEKMDYNAEAKKLEGGCNGSEPMHDLFTVTCHKTTSAV